VRPRESERDHDQPARDPAQPPALPEHGHLGHFKRAARPPGKDRDGRGERLADRDGDEHGTNLREPVHRCSPPDQPLEDDHRHNRPGHMTGRVGERDPQRLPLAREVHNRADQVPEQDPGPPAQATQVQHRNSDTGGRPEGTHAAGQQEDLAALGSDVVAAGDQEDPDGIPHRPS
jgi:hypothetical protein